MKANEIKLGSVYAVEVSGRIAPVKIEAPNQRFGGWEGVNLRTYKDVRIRSAARLRYEVEAIPNGWRRVGSIKHIQFS